MMKLEYFEVEQILGELKLRMKDPARSDLKDKYDSGIELFESYLKGNQREGLYQLKGDIQVKDIRIVKPSKLKNLLRTIYKKIKRNL
ncbi:hypothetical protein [Paenibacillus andongensis]|uniref:hypothetical protein n=1 Tax=Paenibacillus andongensis TaxID=2975482 RepID=UPI0021BAA0DF|nr:hypothetical protein [Paenibacillus andongensis]